MELVVVRIPGCQGDIYDTWLEIGLVVTFDTRLKKSRFSSMVSIVD